MPTTKFPKRSTLPSFGRVVPNRVVMDGESAHMQVKRGKDKPCESDYKQQNNNNTPT